MMEKDGTGRIEKEEKIEEHENREERSFQIDPIETLKVLFGLSPPTNHRM